MSKRQASNYLTKEPYRNRPDELEENDRDKVDPVQIASADVMATRKLAKPRKSRFANQGATATQNNGINGGISAPKPPSSGAGGLFGSIKTTAPSLPTSSFSFGSSVSSNPFAKITTTTTMTPASTTTTTTTTTAANPFAGIKPSESKPFSGLKSLGGEQKPMFPPNSPFARHPPAPTPTPSSFTREMASQQVTPVSQTQQKSSGPIRTPRQPLHTPAVQSYQTPQPRPSQTPTQRTLTTSDDNIPIPTPDRNPSDPPEKHYWHRIKAMNAAFSEAVSRSLENDAYCNLEWLFGQYKYWRDEIEKGYPYDSAVDSPGVSQRTRVGELRSGVAIKPATPRGEFVRSQAPPPETQVAWDGGSTQSTERSRSFGPASQGSKTADTILGVLESPSQRVPGYLETMESVKKRTTVADNSIFKFGSTEGEKGNKQAQSVASFGPTGTFKFGESAVGTTSTSEPLLFGGPKLEEPKAESVPTKPVFGTPSMKSFSFSQPSSFASKAPITSQPAVPKPTSFGQGSSFATSTTPAKPFGPSTFSTPKAPSFPARKPEPTRPSPSKAGPPHPVIEKASNRFAALSAPEEKEVINLDSDEEEPMAEEGSGQDEEMTEESPEEESEEQMEEEEGEEMEDDVKDQDYVVLEDETPSEEEIAEEPKAEEVAKEVEELVKSTPEKLKEEISKIPKFEFKPSGGALFGSAPATGSTPQFTLSFSAPAGTAPFKFGVTVKETKEETKTEEPKPAKVVTEPAAPKEPAVEQRKSPPQAPPSPRRLRSASPAKRTEDAPASPSKRKRSLSPQKPAKIETTTTIAPEPFKFGEPLKPFSFGGKAISTPAAAPSAENAEQPPPVPFRFTGPPPTEPLKPFVFGGTPSKEPQEPPKTFTFGSTATSDESQATTKPFTFSASANKDFTWTPDKPIKFDTPPSTMPKLPPPPTFGSSQPFQFGGISTPAPPAAPSAAKFGSFGGSPSAFSAFTGASTTFTSPNLGFSFGQTKSESKEESKEETQPEGEGEDEENAPPQPEEVGTAGEEDEENIFSERAKLILRLSPAEKQKEIDKRVAAGGKAEEVKGDRDFGIGVVRVNIHKETKKCRILFRLEGSGRVVLNSYLLPGLNYQKQGKTLVLIPALRDDGQGLDTYFVKVKEPAVAENLAKLLEEKKNIA